MNSKRGLDEKIKLGTLLTKKVILTSAQVKALRATPIEIVSALPGRILRFVGATLSLNYGGTNAFTESTANLGFKYTNGSGVQVSSTVESTGFIDQTASTVTSADAAQDAIVTKAASLGKSLVLHNLGAGEIAGNAAGDNTVTVLVSYVVDTI